MADRPTPAARTIKPLKLQPFTLPIIAATLSDEHFLGKGIPHSPDDFSRFHITRLSLHIRNSGPGILVTNDSHRLLLMLERECAGDPSWQVKVAIREGMIARHDERICIRKSVIGFVGFRRAPGERTKNRYWHVLDPSVFLDDAKAALPLAELALWAEDVCGWCGDNGIHPRPTAGGLAGQLLRHPRFYGEPRRKVPGATNERAREALPGNHYELRADRNRTYAADYIDQASAHHHAALAAPVPDAFVYAVGHYRDMRDTEWCQPADIAGSFGLIRARIWTPDTHKYPTQWKTWVDDFRPAWAQSPGSRLAYLYTNELDLLAELGGRIEYITAAWLSDTHDPGLQAYAQWALEETARAEPERREWLKRVLLTPYGLLAARPDFFEVGFRRARGGEIRPYPIGGTMMPFHIHRTSKPVHPRIAHVIQRGMIEAETRAESIRFANRLLAEGEHVLCIYSDGVLVRTLPWRTQARLVTHPWRHKATLTGLRFISEQAFESQQIVRLPGIPVAGRSRKAFTSAAM